MNIHSVNSRSLFSLGYRLNPSAQWNGKSEKKWKPKDGPKSRLAESGIAKTERPPLCSGGPIVLPLPPAIGDWSGAKSQHYLEATFTVTLLFATLESFCG